jgi:hypothetical protein
MSFNLEGLVGSITGNLRKFMEDTLKGGCNDNSLYTAIDNITDSVFQPVYFASEHWKEAVGIGTTLTTLTVSTVSCTATTPTPTYSKADFENAGKNAVAEYITEQNKLADKKQLDKNTADIAGVKDRLTNVETEQGKTNQAVKDLDKKVDDNFNATNKKIDDQTTTLTNNFTTAINNAMSNLQQNNQNNNNGYDNGCDNSCNSCYQQQQPCQQFYNGYHNKRISDIVNSDVFSVSFVGLDRMYEWNSNWLGMALPSFRSSWIDGNKNNGELKSGTAARFDMRDNTVTYYFKNGNNLVQYTSSASIAGYLAAFLNANPGYASDQFTINIAGNCRR